MNIKSSIENLRTLSQQLEKAANKHENYNAEYAGYLEVMSFEMHKFANDLQRLESNFGVSRDMMLYD